MALYQGGCHCGKVRIQADLDLAQTIVCNCSICTKHGFIWGFVPKDQVQVTAGEADTTEYRFHTHKIGHRFCRTCGVEAFAFGEAPGGAQMAAVNVRCLDGVDLGRLEPRRVDGASL